MNRRRQTIAVLALVSLWACSPAPRSNPPGAAATQAAVVAQSPPAPAKHFKMICRNSQNGAKAECGTPNAVMVGVKAK